MYSIKLTNYAFDNSYSNVRLFDDKSLRDQYFDNLAGVTQNVDNFNAGNLINTQITIDIDKSIPLTKLLNFNYVIVKLLNEDGEISSENETLYFHAFNLRQVSQQRIALDLEIDPFMTYWYDIKFSDCLINRVHLDRFEKDGTSYVFKGKADSDLFEREDIKNVPQRLISRQALKLNTGAGSDVSDFINENVMCWCYVICGTGKMKIKNVKNNTDFEKEFSSTYAVYKNAVRQSEIEYGYKLFCFPIKKGFGKPISAINTDAEGYKTAININSQGFKSFVEKNGYSNIFSIKLSVKPPVDFDQLDVTVDGSLIIKSEIEIDGTFVANRYNIIACEDDGSPRIYNGIINVIEDSTDPITFDVDIQLPKISFSRTEIIGKNRDKVFNPKINSADYKILRLTFAGNYYDIDIQKLNNTTIRFYYNEMITPDVTRGILRIKNTTADGVFNKLYSSSFNGFIFTNDLSLTYTKSVFENFIANNKNAYLSFQNQQTYNLTSATANSAFKMIGSLINPAGAPSGALSSMADLVNVGLKNTYDAAQFNLTIDNMKNAPDSLANANGNAIFISAVAEFGIYAEIYSALESELNVANDYQFENGYYYNQYGNIKNFAHTRKFFNYIQAVPDNIVGNISNDLKQKIKMLLARGVRFWHVDEISYDKENYELLLEEGEQNG